MVNLHKLRLADGMGFPRLWNRLLDELQRNTIVSVASPLMLSQDTSGQRLGIIMPQQQLSTSATIPPFRIYQHSASPAAPTTDWRTVAVKSGMVNAVIPSGTDDENPDPLIVVPASTTAFKIWIECTVETDGSVSAVAIDSGATGWTDYPDQPAPTVSGEPASAFYILLGTVTTSNDTLKTLTISQIINTHLQALLFSMGGVINGDGEYMETLQLAALPASA
jgi:hypothetical protein